MALPDGQVRSIKALWKATTLDCLGSTSLQLSTGSRHDQSAFASRSGLNSGMWARRHPHAITSNYNFFTRAWSRDQLGISIGLQDSSWRYSKVFEDYEAVERFESKSDQQNHSHQMQKCWTIFPFAIRTWTYSLLAIWWLCVKLESYLNWSGHVKRNVLGNFFGFIGTQPLARTESVDIKHLETKYFWINNSFLNTYI